MANIFKVLSERKLLNNYLETGKIIQLRKYIEGHEIEPDNHNYFTSRYYFGDAEDFLTQFTDEGNYDLSQHSLIYFLMYPKFIDFTIKADSSFLEQSPENERKLL